MSYQRASLLPVLSLLGVGCLLALSELSSAIEPVRQDCAAYEDAWIRFKCPAGWKTRFHFNTVPERTWQVFSPEAENSALGKIYITENLAWPKNWHKKRSLEQIFEETKNSETAIILEEPKKLSIGGAKCLTFKWSSRLWTGGHANFDPDAPPLLVTANADAHCRNQQENYVAISMELSSYEPGKPDERYRKNAAIFDRVLKSLEFK